MATVEQIDSRFVPKKVSDGSIIPFVSGKIREETDKLIDSCEIRAGRVKQVEIGEEIEVVNTETGERIFGGYIKNIRQREDGFFRLEADEFLTEVVDTRVKKSFREVSPEFILNDLIENNTSLTLETPIDSNITLTSYVIEGKIEKAVKELTDLLDWQIRTESDRTVYFEPRGRIE